MKKRLLLLLILPLLASCGNKNKGSSEVQSSKEDESSIISESSESTTSENEDSSSSSEEPDVPEQPDYFDVKPHEEFDITTLEPINTIAMNLILEEAIANSSLFNSYAHLRDSGDNYNFDQVFGPFSKYFYSSFCQINYEEDIYFDDLASSCVGSYCSYENVGFPNGGQYYYSYDYSEDIYYSEPDELDVTLMTEYYRYYNVKGHENNYDSLYESTILASREDVINSLGGYLDYYLSDIKTIANNLNSLGSFAGIKDGVYYFGHSFNGIFYFDTDEVINNIVLEGENVYCKYFTVKNDEELGYVIDELVSIEHNYATENIYGEEFDEKLLTGFYDEVYKFSQKELGSYVEPTIDEERLASGINDAYYPYIYFFDGTSPFTEYDDYDFFNVCGCIDGVYYFKYFNNFDKNDVFSFSACSDPEKGFDLLDNENVNWLAGKDLITSIDDPVYENLYTFDNYCTGLFYLGLDKDGNLVSMDIYLTLTYKIL